MASGPWDNYAASAPATPVAGPWSNYAKAAPSTTAPSAPSSGDQPSLATGLGRGAELGTMSDWDRAAEALARGAGDVAHLAGDKSWMPGASLTAKDLAAEKAFREEYSNQPGFGVGDVAGSIAGTLPTAAIGGGVAGPVGLAARALGAMGAGAEAGAPGARGATEGAAIGLGTMGAGAGVGHLVKKFVRPEAQRLMAAGVKLTPGQMHGGFYDTAEQKLAGVIPITGDLIKRARDQSIHDFNTATMNSALGEVGDRLTGAAKSGYDAVRETGDKLSAAYDRILDNPNLKFVADNQFASDINDIAKESQTLPKVQKEQLDEIVNYALNDPSIQGLPTGRQIKTGLSTFGTYIKKYSGSALPAERHMADLLRDYQTAMKDNLSRSNPQDAKQLNAVDRGWAKLVRIENAAGRRATSDGVFTPADLLASERGATNSVRKRSFSRGEGLFQDWARDAQKILPSKVPDSGTTGRLVMERALAHPFKTGAEGAAGVAFSPLLVPAAAGALGYSGPGISAANAIADPRVSAAIAQALGTTGRYVAAPVSGLVQQAGSGP